jgi:uncharacterized glyoxalase superfamily protein PhnB
MSAAITPLLHVPDVVKTAAWYARLGFATRDIGYHGDQAVFAALTFGDSEVMLSVGGHASDDRRDADLYIRRDDIVALFDHLRSQVDVVEEPHETFYGIREFIIRDVNGFWITFGESVRR